MEMINSAGSYRELIVWQEAIKIAKAVYELTENFRSKKSMPLADQIRRAAVPSRQILQKARRENLLGI